MEERLNDSSKILERLRDKRIGRDVSKEAPKVSVVIPAYNISRFVAETLESVFAQTFQDFEVVIVNDGSKDSEDLESVLNAYFDRIVYARQRNMGASEARNAAICLSRGELIAFLDGDDIWLPACLERQVAFLEGNRLDMVYCDAELFGDNFLNGRTYMETTPSNGAVTTESLISGTCNVITSGTVVTRAILEKANLFDTGVKRAQDFDLWFRLAKRGAAIDYQREVLIRYRVSSDSLSGSNVARAERNLSILNSIRQKYEFTDAEHRVWASQVAFCQAEVELEKGKANLVKGYYSEAKRNFGRANEYYRRPKLRLLNFLINISPALTLRLFKKFRPNEFGFISEAEARD